MDTFALWVIAATIFYVLVAVGGILEEIRDELRKLNDREERKG